MSFFNDMILPRHCHLSRGNRHLVPCRKRVPSMANDHVLEIGIDSGLNLPFYASVVRDMQGLESSPRLFAMARRSAGEAAVPVTVIEGSRE